MNEIKYLLKQNYCVLINFIKVGLIKYIYQTVGILIFGFVFLFLINNYINNLFSELEIVNSVNYFFFLKQSYSFIYFLFILITFGIMFSAHKSSEYTWNRLKAYTIYSDNIFIGYIILYLLIALIVLSFFIISIFLSIKGNILLSLLYILFIAMNLSGNLIISMYIYKLINIIMKKRISFALASIITSLVLYSYNFIFFEYNLFKNIRIEICTFIIVPFIVGNIIRYCINKYNIEFFNISEEKENKNAKNKVYMKIRNPYIFILVIEFCREWKRYVQAFILPYIAILLFRILNINISFEDYNWIFSTIAAVPVGIYYSYNECHKINSSNYIFSIMTRILFSITLVFISCFLCNFIGCEFNSAERYFECISYSIIIIYILSLLKIPMIIYEKDSPLFYILIYLIPTISNFLLRILNDIVNNYINIEGNVNIIHIIIFMAIIIVILKGSEKYKFL